MSVLDTLLSVIAPLECLGCSSEGTALCLACSAKLTTTSQSHCFRCERPTTGNTTCKDCFVQFPLYSVLSRCNYEGLAKKLVHEFKFTGKRSIAKDLARLMSGTPLPISPKTIVVYVPTATSRVRSRGFDHARLLAKVMSRLLGLPLARALVRTTQARQVGYGRSERAKHIHGAFTVRLPKSIKNAHILLVDDVVTTGATLGEAARVLQKAGAARIDAVVFASTPK